MFESIHDFMYWLGGGATLYLIPFLIAIGVLVFVHEWGHFIVARLCGVRVETFSIGFGKKLWTRKDKQGTEWQVALIPLGGYVKMFGDTDPASSKFSESVEEEGQLRAMTAEEKAVSFYGKPVWQRAAIVFAGPAINFIFAILVLACMYTTVGRPVTPPLAGAVIVGGAAYEGGFQPDDRVLTIDGEKIYRFADIQRAVAISLDKPLVFEVEREGKVVTLNNVKPRLDTVTDRFGFSHSRGLMGIIGPGLGLDVESIQAVDGQTGDITGLLKARMGQVVRLSMKAIGDFPAQDITVRLHADTNEGFIKGEGDLAKTIQIAMHDEPEVLKFAPLEAVSESISETWFVSVGTLQTLGQMVIGTRSAQELGGIIRIGAVTGDAAQQGFFAFLTLCALLSINLGLINLLPIPMLDGGHLTFYAIEAIKGKPVSEKVQDMALRFGFVLLIALMVFANLNDLIQLSK
ncbi:MAG: RIP metalloprotease RseP [Alphaproteobacteria bacterium]|nr:RIP metalloprotease RseP [Alphaproteobacteria bacterium]